MSLKHFLTCMLCLFFLNVFLGCSSDTRSASHSSEVLPPDLDPSDPPRNNPPENPEPEPEPEVENPLYDSTTGGTKNGLPLSSVAVCNSTSAACTLLKSQFQSGLAAGNLNDWYENRDGNHSTVNISVHPQVQRMTVEGNAVSLQSHANKNVIGNASLGVSGMWNMVRYSYYQNASSVQNMYNQFRSNDHFWYPSVYDYRLDSPADRDERYAMTLYESSSLGKSGTDRDKVSKFYYAMAALRPLVKDRLEKNGMLINTVQMIFRRTLVDNSADYYTNLAHRSAYKNDGNELKIVEFANAILPSNIPPMVLMKVESEEFINKLAPHRLYALNKTEHLFTTPNAVARVYRELGKHSKKMIVNFEDSIDLNSRALSYQVKLIRGNAGDVVINKLNASGSRQEIIFKPKAFGTFGEEERTSSLIILGVFANNGVYDSAPGFITVANLDSDSVLYENNEKTRLIARGTRSLHNVHINVDWASEKYTYDNSLSLTGFERTKGSVTTPFNKYGLVIDNGDPTKVRQIQYVDEASKPTKYNNAYSDFRMISNLITQNLSSSAGGSVDCTMPPTTTNIIIGQPGFGNLTYDSSRRVYVYTPNSTYEGSDYFLIRADDSTASVSNIIACNVDVLDR